MERVSLMDKLAGTALSKTRRNALSESDAAYVDDRHNEMLSRMKRRKKKKMIADRAKEAAEVADAVMD